jgi:hypothetical protein
MPSLLREPRDAIAALLRSPELILEERIILRANNGKVVRHFSSVRGGSEVGGVVGFERKVGKSEI